MRTFKISKKIEVVCEWKKTRTAFKHVATLLLDGKEVESAKVCYLNRTWESYKFQTVLGHLVKKSTVLTEEEKKVCNKFIDGNHTDWSDFKQISNIAKLGDVFCDNQKDKNDWKKRMIKAGFENKGLTIPDDWDTLDEATKEARLNKIIKLAGNVGGK